MKKNQLFFFPILILLTCNATFAQYTVAKIFSEHMVLQRDQPIKIWGQGSPGTQLVGTFKGEVQPVKIKADRTWEMTFKATKAGGPYKLNIIGAREKFEWKDIYVGDVWLCSGQSNMEWLVKNSNDAKQEIAAAKDDRIRQFKVPHSFSDTAAYDLAGGEWITASSQTVGDFTAVGYFFARELRGSEGVPIGLLNSSWGGSRIEPWMTAEALQLESTEDFLKQLKTDDDNYAEEVLNKIRKYFTGFKRPEKALEKKTVKWEELDYDDAHWTTISENGNWETQGFEGIDGVMWYRKEVELTKKQSKKIAKVNLGKIDDSDITYINGVQVGSLINKYNETRLYDVPAEVLKAGKNVIAIRSGRSWRWWRHHWSGR